MSTLKNCSVLLLAIAAFFVFTSPDVLNGLDSNREYGPWELQAAITGFCMSPLPGKLMNAKGLNTTGGDFEFEKDGDIENDDYVQGSIYAILYALYKNTGIVTSNLGVPYQFTFNTWGIAPSPYPVEDPQRHGKAAYAGLVTQPPAMEYAENLKNEGKRLKIVEIGCGTGAGANLITREVWPTSQYLALDMQAAAINTCNEIHATEDNPGLECRLVPNGVGRDGNKVPMPNNSVDFVVISETHIADIEIGDLEKSIFAEIRRILKPGGLFLWGNAIPTRVWEEAMDYLPNAGFELVNNYNHTKGAVVARDEDHDRVVAYIDHIIGQYPVMKVPYFGDRCAKVTERLIANFYRHPGTALYLKMVTGYDSYMHQAWRKSE